MIIDREIKIRWAMPNGVAIWTLDKPTIENMKRAGCYKITFGLESGSLNTLQFIRKEFIDFKKATELIKFCNRSGLWTMASFIIGFPYEKKDDIDKTLSFAINCDVDMASFFCATPYPDTELYAIYKKEGFIKDLREQAQLEWTGEKTDAMCDTRYLTKEEINILIQDLKKKFLRKRCISFLNPSRVIRKLKGFEEIIYFLKMIRNYFPSVRASF